MTGYAVQILEANLEQAVRQIQWLGGAKDIKTTKYFREEYEKCKARKESLEDAISILKKSNKSNRRLKHGQKRTR